ncbi:unnamed protein product, partial [Hymenolepis diminuta]
MCHSKRGNDEKCSRKELRNVFKMVKKDIHKFSRGVESINYPEVLEQQINANNLTDFELAYDTIVTPYGIHYDFLGGCLLFLLDMLFEHVSKPGQDESFIGIMREFLNVPGLFVAQPTIRKIVIIGWIALIRDFLPLARKFKRIDWKIVAKMQIEKSIIEGYQIQMNIIYDTIMQV